MVRKIPIKPKVNEQRNEDFMKMDSLHYLADQHGLRIFRFYDTPGHCVIEYISPSKAIEPKLEECRDAQDYELRFAAWMKAITVKSPSYDKFQDMVLGEIRRLNALPL